MQRQSSTIRDSHSHPAKRALAIMLSGILAFTLMPSTAYAQDNSTESLVTDETTTEPIEPIATEERIDEDVISVEDENVTASDSNEIVVEDESADSKNSNKEEVSLETATTAGGDYTLQVQSGQDITDVLNRYLGLAKSMPSDASLTVRVPAGSYTLNNVLAIYSNTTLIMNGVTLKRTTGQTMLRLRRASEWKNAGGYAGYSGGNNIHIQGGTWDGNGTDDAIILIGHAQNISLEGCTFTSSAKHEVEFGACKNVVVRNCTFKNYTGSKWNSSSNVEALQFDATQEDHFSKNYIPMDRTVCTNVTVEGCTFSHVQRGIGTHTIIVGQYSDNMLFRNNTFDDIAGYAIITSNYRNSNISGNKITRCGSGIMMRTYGSSNQVFMPVGGGSGGADKLNTTISNNTISVTETTYPNNAFGINLYGKNLKSATNGVAKGDYRAKGVRVENNTINMTVVGLGIWLQDANDNTITKNKITTKFTKAGKAKAHAAICLTGSSSNKITSNTIKNKNKKGNGKKMSGIRVFDGSNSNTLSSNKIDKASMYGVYIYKSKKIKLTSNKITKSGIHGVALDGKATVTKFKKNKITKSGKKNVVVGRGCKLKK